MGLHNHFLHVNNAWVREHVPASMHAAWREAHGKGLLPLALMVLHVCRAFHETRGQSSQMHACITHLSSINEQLPPT